MERLTANENLISISEYSYVQENWKKIIKFVVKVVSPSGEASTLRSAKDFKELRNILITHWPGCIIPGLPEVYMQVIFI